MNISATTPTLATPTIDIGADDITVRVKWNPSPDLDRLDAAAWGLKRSHVALAKRLVRAIEAGAVVQPDVFYTDVNGQRGCHTRTRVMGRTLNADLTRLGF